MNSIVSEITKSITGKTSVYNCSVEELKQIVSQYPYFGPAQFLYVKKLKEDNSSLLENQKQKASLYFQNPIWLKYLLDENSITVETETILQPEAKPQIKEAEKEEAVKNAVISSRQSQTEAPATFKEIEKEEAVSDAGISSIQAQTEAPATFKEVEKEEAVSDAGISSIQAQTEAPATFKEIEKEEAVSDAGISSIQSQTEAPATFKEIEKEEAVSDAVISSIQSQTEAPATFKEAEKEKSVTDAVISPIQAEIETPATFEEVVVQTHNQAEEPVQVEKEPEPVSVEPAPVEHIITQFKFQPIDRSKAAMIFEPYHTVDYFASQGIKPKEEEKPKDRFSQQLRSFTEWLKVMKRLPVSEIAAAVSSSDEKKVEQMAAVSINDREVVTEAMAEVWEKQGNHAKAIETYEKLSLLNPGKNSFFAAKIEHLKTL